MKKAITFYTLTLAGLISFSVNAQNTRLNNYNSIGWYNFFGTIKVSKKIGIHTEYQFRRIEVIDKWQQSLLRAGINYQFNTKTMIRIGYALIETLPYGDIPINSMGKEFTEHRMFQMLTLTDKVSTVELSHRFMLEQRWVGRYSATNLSKEDEYPLLHRMRYMFRMQMPLKGTEIIDKTPYLALYNELFIGFGNNVNENVFDQNRFGALLGYKLNSKIKIEAGYLNQTLQLGREVNNRNVFQHNNGLIVNIYLNADLSTKN